MKYDLAVMGGGPAGYSAALRGVSLGLSVILFEKEQLGGTCLNRGCVPTKFLAHVGEIYAQSRNSTGLGVITDDVRLDYGIVKKKKEQVVAELRSGLESLLMQQKIAIVNGTAQMLDCQHIVCGNVVYETENILIATGSVAAQPPFEGTKNSDEILQMEKIPKSVRIIGGGVIAVEFAHILNLMGTEVIISIRGERILRSWDKEIAVSLTQNFKRRGIKIETGCSFSKIDYDETEIVVSALGRKANLSGVNDSLVSLDDNGAVIVSNQFLTKTEHIYAAGDVISESSMLAHTAMEQGKMVAEIIAGRQTGRPSAVINCIYTRPEIASVGMTEMQAKQQKINIITAKRNLRSNARTLISGTDRSFIKILADANTHRIIGAQLMCERASDIADEIALAINNDLTIGDLCTTARPHPSFCEAITDVAEALKEKTDEF